MNVFGGDCEEGVGVPLGDEISGPLAFPFPERRRGRHRRATQHRAQPRPERTRGDGVFHVLAVTFDRASHDVERRRSELERLGAYPPPVPSGEVRRGHLEQPHVCPVRPDRGTDGDIAHALDEHLESPRAPQRVLRRRRPRERRPEGSQQQPLQRSRRAFRPGGRRAQQPLDPDHLHERGEPAALQQGLDRRGLRAQGVRLPEVSRRRRGVCPRRCIHPASSRE